MKKILLTGKNGQVGWELQRTLVALGKVWAYDRQELDLQDKDALRQVIREIKPDIIVNAAAYTAVDKAETDQDAAHAINVVAPQIMAEEARRCGAFLVHYSTDYVFDGTASKPYIETDPVRPLSIYGKTKLAGELAIREVCERHLILRTSWVYGTRGKNFLLTMQRLGKERDLLKIVGDQVGAPTWSRLIASMTAQMIVYAQKNDVLAGTYHMTSAGQTSWYGFAKEIFNIQQADCGAAIPKLEEITTKEYPLPAIRPSYSVLSNEKLAKSFQLEMPDWKECLHLCLDKGNHV
jgi:dTDP-4-dehydrorhamnose reductase